MKKIKSVKWRVQLSYRNAFVFRSLYDSLEFITTAVNTAEDPEDVESFEITPVIEYKEAETVYTDTDSIKEADKMEIKQKLNAEFGVAASKKEEENV